MQLGKLRQCVALLAALIVTCSGISSAVANNLIGVNFTTAASATPDPQNWNRYSVPDGTLSNLTDDTGASTSANFTATGLGPAPNGLVYLATSTLQPDAVPQFNYSLSGMTGYGFRSNGVFEFQFSGLQASTPYEYWFVAYRGATIIDNLVGVSNGDTPNATTFNQFVTAANNGGRFIVNTTVSNNTQQFNDLANITTSSSTGTITFNLQGVSQTPAVGAIAIRAVPEPSSLILMLGAPLLFALRSRRRLP